MNRAYSLLEIKSFDDDLRTFEGIATTPTTDRMGDIVEPKGAQFTLPIPLLWQHNSRQPIGHVTEAKVTDAGIRVKGKLVTVDEPVSLKEELDRAWAMIKAKLVRGLSIGFKPIESAQIKDSFAERYIKWDWLELSAVTIAANAEASILSIKSIDDQQLRAASGDNAKPVVRLTKPPGVPGKTIPKGHRMKTIKERIAAFQAERMAKAARVKELVSKEDGGSTLESAEQEEFDTLDAEIKEIDGHLKRLARAEELNIDQAEAAVEKKEERKVPALTGVRTKANLEQGVPFARYAMAMVLGKGDPSRALAQVQNNKTWMDQTPQLETVLKAAVAAGDTTTSGWASELVYAQNLANEFLEYLRPMTILGQLNGFRRVPFNMRVGKQTAGGTGYWVGQGKPIPLSKLTTSSATLGMTKAAGMMAIDEELARSSSPSAELLVRNDLARCIQYLLDVALIDPNQGGVANVQPASLTYGLTPVTPSGTNFAAIATDIKSLFSTSITANLDISKYVWVMTPTTALALSLMQTSLGNPQFPTISITGGTWMGLPVIVSNSANIAGSPDYGNMIILINPSEVFLADEGQVTIEVSREASIEMLDNPTNTSTGGTVATTSVSMFQTDSMAIRAIRFINWAKARAEAVAYIRTSAYA